MMGRVSMDDDYRAYMIQQIDSMIDTADIAVIKTIYTMVMTIGNCRQADKEAVNDEKASC